MTMRMLPGAVTDALSNCYIKEFLVPTLQKLKEESDRLKKPFSLLILDVDHFKTFNDKYGHMHGDEVLKYFSSALHLSLVDVEHIAFRFGGDEFIVLFPGLTPRWAHDKAVQLQENVRSRMFLLKGNQYRVSFSGGVAAYPDDAKDGDDLLEKADKALYCSKKNGRGRSTRFDKIFLERFRHIIMIAVLLAAVAAILLSYSAEIAGFAKRILRTRVTVNPTNQGATFNVPVDLGTPKESMDELYLTTGDILVGRILVETDDEIHMSLKLSHGEARFPVKKSQILKRSKTGDVDAETKFVVDSSLTPPRN